MVASGNIDEKYASKELAEFGQFLQMDDFWNNQIEQVYVMKDRKGKRVVELVPRVGDQIVYLGAVNHIIDIELITEFLRHVKEFLGGENRELLLHLIGEGEHKQDFLRSLAEGEIPFRDYGAVYEEEQKKSILQPCSFGLNFMKSSVRVGLTMKSIDYLSFGIPILNTIPDDTWELVDREKIGVNVDRDHLETAVQAVAEISGDPEEWQAMHVRARETFEKNFTRQAFWQVLDRVGGGWTDAQNGASSLWESACRQADAECLQADTDAEKRLLSSSEKDK